MKLIASALISCLLLLSSVSALGQTRSRRTTTPQRRRQPAATTPATSRLDEARTNTARLQLADQIKSLSRFLYLYGRFSKDFELTGARAGGDGGQVAKTRAELVGILGKMRQDLDELEAQFRLAPGLQRHYQRLSGVAQKAADAERHAGANRLDQAGRLLVEVTTQLTDVLLEM